MRISRLASLAARLTGCLVLAVGVWTLALSPTRPLDAADSVDPGVIPPDGAAFATVKFDEVWQSEALKEVRDLIQKEMPQAQQQIESLIGLKIDDIERVSVFLPTLPGPNSGEPGFGFVVTAKKAYDPVRLLNSLDAYSLNEIDNEPRNFRAPPAIKMELKSTAPLPTESKPPAEKKRPTAPLSDLPNGGPEEGKQFGQMRLPELGAPFYASKRNGFLVYLVSDRSFVIFPMESREDVGVYGYLGLLLRRSTTGNLSPALAGAAKNQIVVGVDLKQANKVYSKVIPDQFPGRTLLSANSATLTVNVAKEVSVNVAFDCPDADTSRSIEQTVNGLLTIARETLPGIRKEVLRNENMKAFAPLVDQFETAIKGATCRTAGRAVTLAASAPSEAILGTTLAALVEQTRKSAERSRFLNNFKQVALAALNFESAYGHFPFPGLEKAGPVARDPAKAILSWRVALLPYIEQEALFRRFKLDEPWDSEHNKKLIPLMPKVYAARKEANLKDGETLVQMFQGPRGLKPRPSFGQITDGSSNTFMVAEAGEPVIWTKPDDMKFDPEKDLPKLGGNFNGDFIVAFCDGSVRFMERKKVTDEILKWFIMPDDGHVIPFDR